ncbi:MAG: DMT family transporter [Lachnospiraceae bacterium]
MFGVMMALVSGALMSIQGVFNTEVTKQSSIWAAAGFVQLTAFVTCAAAWYVTGKGDVAGMFHMDKKYMLLGGVIGAFITITVIKSMDALGPAKAVMIIVISQLAVAYLIELFGLFGVEKVGFEWKKALGMALAVAGIVIFKWES